ncbi:hypothetical protein BJX63DRAFT_261035 [Aspergillus granulosus]|uniref:Uncharacterized protein n=1 Tax=Aspergillus granulosus TaxID=176169 RepID=A0ABR4H9P5_9EURO
MDGMDTGKPMSEMAYHGILDWLQLHAQGLEGTIREFKNNATRMKIKVFSAYEQYPTQSHQQASLDGYTGALGLKTEKIQMMAGCNYHSLTMFSSKDDENYKFIISAIKKGRKIVAQASDTTNAASTEAPRGIQISLPASTTTVNAPYNIPLPPSQIGPPLAMPTPLPPINTFTHVELMSTSQGPGSISTEEASSKHSTALITPISTTQSIDPSKMQITRRPVGLPPSTRISPGVSVRSSSSASNNSAHASAHSQPMNRPGPLRSVSQPSVTCPLNMPIYTSTRSLSDATRIPLELQAARVAQHPSHPSLPGQTTQDPSRNSVPLKRQSHVKSVRSIDGLPEGVDTQSSLEMRVSPPEIQHCGQPLENNIHPPHFGANGPQRSSMSPSAILQHNIPTSHTRPANQPTSQHPAVPHPPRTTRFMHSTHPSQQAFGPLLREPPRPQRLGHSQSPSAQLKPPPALIPGPFQHFPQHPPQMPSAKTKKANNTPKPSKKEQKQMAIQPQGGPLQPALPKPSKKEQNHLLRQTGAHPPIQPYHASNKPPKQALARSPRNIPTPSHGASLGHRLEPAKPPKKSSLFSRVFGGSSHHSTPTPPFNPHAHASGTARSPSSFSGPTGPRVTGRQAAPPNKPPKVFGSGGRKPLNPPGNSRHGFGHGWGHHGAGPQPPGSCQANSTSPSGVGNGGLFAAGVEGAALGGLAAAGIMHGMGDGGYGDESEGDNSDEDGEETDDIDDDDDDEDDDEEDDDESDEDEDDEDEDEDEDDEEDSDEEDEDDDDDDDDSGAYSYEQDDY